MKQVSKVIKNGVTYYFADSALTQSVDNIVDTLNNLSIPDSTSDLINDSGFLDSSDFKTINNQSIVGSGNIDIQGGGVTVSSITQSQYDNLPSSAKTDDIIWIITDVNPSDIVEYSAGTNIDITDYVISVTGITVPTKTSDLTNDSNFLTKSSGDTLYQPIGNYATQSDLANVSDSIPTSTSELTNDSNFVASTNLKTINNQSIVGSGNIDIQGGGISVVEISQTDYDALPTSAKTDTSKIYVISGATSNYYTKSEVDALIPTSTSDLTNDSNFVASTNLKTINNQSIVGSGNVVVPTFTYDLTTQTLNITTS